MSSEDRSFIAIVLLFALLITTAHLTAWKHSDMGQRRTKPHAEKGQPFAREWVEYHAECAVYGCTRKTLISQIGQASTVESDLRVWSFRDEKSRAGWTRRDGLFYCPEHEDFVMEK